MKRIIPALLIAVLVHVFLLSLHFQLIGQASKKRPDDRRLVSIRLLQREAPSPPPAAQASPPPPPPPPKKVPEPPKPKTPPVVRKEAPQRKPPEPEPEPTLPVTETPEPPPAFPPQTEAVDTENTSREAEVEDLPPQSSVDGDAETLEKKVEEAVPLYDVNPPPVYPAVARRRGYQGTVMLEVLVDRSGRVADVRVFKTSGHEILDRTALQSIKEWKFKPGTRDGRPADVWVRVPVGFRLQ